MSRTCSASRHAVIIATQIERGEKIEDPEHAAESIHATVDALWKARAENNELQEKLRWALNSYGRLLASTNDTALDAKAEGK
jgi:hypothetical protein